jgi:diaminopimelate epimerase
MDFFKMHGLGNDFIVLNCFRAKIAEPRRLAKKICDRRLGIGGDGVIFAMPSQKANCRMRIFNCDGSEAEMSGNGIRCLGKFLRDKGIAKGKVITVETNAGIRTLQVVSGSGRITNIRVDMGKPDLPEKDSAPWTFQDEGINVLDRMFKPTALSMGNPHCVIFVDDTEAFLVEKYGPAIENHTGFPQRTNVEFVEIISRREIRQRTWGDPRLRDRGMRRCGGQRDKRADTAQGEGPPAWRHPPGRMEGRRQRPADRARGDRIHG